MIKLCGSKVKTNHLFDCEVIGNSIRYYKKGKWQNLDPRTRTENTFSLNIESNAKIKFKVLVVFYYFFQGNILCQGSDSQLFWALLL